MSSTVEDQRDGRDGGDRCVMGAGPAASKPRRPAEPLIRIYLASGGFLLGLVTAWGLSHG